MSSDRRCDGMMPRTCNEPVVDANGIYDQNSLYFCRIFNEPVVDAIGINNQFIASTCTDMSCNLILPRKNSNISSASVGDCSETWTRSDLSRRRYLTTHISFSTLDRPVTSTWWPLSLSLSSFVAGNRYVQWVCELHRNFIPEDDIWKRVPKARYCHKIIAPSGLVQWNPCICTQYVRWPTCCNLPVLNTAFKTP